MTGGRHLLLSLLATVLALALGLGLGAGPVAQDDAASSAAESARLSARVDGLQSRVRQLREAATGDARAVAALAAPLTDGVLDGTSVLVVATPGARASDVRAAGEAVEAAGGEVTGTLHLLAAYVDPANAQSPLEDLSLRLVPPEVDFADGSLPIERVGTVLARSTVRDPDASGDTRRVSRSGIDKDAAEVIAGLDELDAVRLDGTPGRLAELALMVTGPGDHDEAEPALLGLLDALDSGGRGAVLTGPGTAKGGLLGAVRALDRAAGPGPSTVDSAGTALGAAATALALAERRDGRSGDYGLAAAARRVLPAAAGG